MIVADFKQAAERLLKRTIRAVRPANARVADLSARIERLEAEKAARCREGIVNAILHASADAYFECVLNGCPVWLPRDTLRTFVHCVQGVVPGPVLLSVEDPHYRWLGSKLRPGQVFLDIGASTGAMTIPMSKHPAGVGKVVAFEPARNANRRLRETLQYNRIVNVEVVDCAVSDRPGTASFSEYGFDETGREPWSPEASAIHSPMIDPSRSQSYEVPVTTIDAFAADRPDAALAKVMKIDVEGFEVHVLEGAAAFLRRVRPHIAIDIHKHPFRPGDTEPPVRELLGAVGYRFEKLRHVLLCTPN